MPLRFRRLAAAIAQLLLALVAPISAIAQPAQTFNELSRRVGVGREVRVADRTGQTTEGDIAAITGSSITLQSKGVTKAFPSEEVGTVTTIKRWGGWGALIGAAGFTAYALVDCRRPNETCGDWPLATLVGAAVGGPVASFLPLKDVVYRAPDLPRQGGAAAR